jgi:hypothetical protein
LAEIALVTEAINNIETTSKHDPIGYWTAHRLIHVEFISQRLQADPQESSADRPDILHSVRSHQLVCQRTSRQQFRPHGRGQTGSRRDVATSARDKYRQAE